MSLRSVFLAVTMTITLLGSLAAVAAVKDDIIDRTSPLGSLCMAGDECAAAVVEVAAGPRSGEDVYNTKCVACHGTGAAGAPKLGDVGAWAPRIAKGNETLYGNAINGINTMPPKGLCGDCSDDEIAAAVDYMVVGSQ